MPLLQTFYERLIQPLIPIYSQADLLAALILYLRINQIPMSLSEFARQQQEFIAKIYPPSLRALHESMKVHQMLKPILDIKPLLPEPALKEYLTAFDKINALSKLNGIELKTAFEVDKFGYIDHEMQRADESQEETNIKIDEAQKLKRIIADVYADSTGLYRLQPREFEEMIAELMRKQGYEVELTKQTRDNGYDILAILRLGSFHAPVKFLVECKRYSERNKIDVGIVRSFKEVIDTEKANRGIIVTTFYFTSDAIKKWEQTPYLLDYRDKDDVLQWVRQYQTSR